MKKILGNKKAISTILAALLMVVIVVVASVMVYAWSTGILGGLLVRPQTGNEVLNQENFAFSSTNTETVTLSLRNAGAADITLITYYVKDTANNQYTRATWTGPTGAPNTLLTATITIGTACGAACTNTGSTFTFANAGAYYVTVVTSRNNQFVFTVTK